MMTLTYLLRARQDGQTELLLFEPRVVAVFPLKEDAERILSSLEHIDVQPQPVEPDEQMVALGSPDQTRVTEIEPAPVSKPKQKSRGLDWDRAMRRLEAGEKLRDVADDMGVDWTALRSRWATHHRTEQPANDTTVACSICAREFRPSPNNPDTCARCSRG